ncbi:MAG: hypothetical protein Q9195_001701 [Heterodermia aff. obscurata]
MATRAGVQIDYFPWFSRQRHAIRPVVESIKDLNKCLADIENVIQQRSSPSGHSQSDAIEKGNSNPYIDAVLISHEFTDHCNEQTLRELDATTPIFATKAAAAVIRRWHHFPVVQDISEFARPACDWTEFSPSLPKWLGIVRFVSSLDIGHLHSAVMICYNLQYDSQEKQPAEAIIYTPHGIRADSLSQISQAMPIIRPLALIHGLHEVFVCGQQLNLGALNGLEVQRSTGAKYWIATHDEVKQGKGLISYLLARNELTLDEATSKARSRDNVTVDSAYDLSNFQFAELQSGESICLKRSGD